MLRNIRKCTVAKADHVSGKMNWDMTLDELDKFIGLVITREILGQRDLPVESFVGYNLGMFNVQRNSIKTQIQGNNAIFTFRREE